ncbi:hypothetical protein Patl1_23301 [Pistacia atlantica]|uniref:Uncharacterized protein n=1 Tax=Pistacia atlantica TaxID=434234 RepID=A0ACC1A1X7_9ROSI|nr:hypothetical protein Patl1_23301 [Pistacia atlantica]
MTVRSCVTWNAMLTGYCSKSKKAKDCAFDALVLFREMLVGINGVKPNDTTMICVLSACSQLGVLETGACVHGYIEKTIYLPENDVFIGTGLVDMYSKYMPGTSEDYVALSNVYASAERWLEVESVRREMKGDFSEANKMSRGQFLHGIATAEACK